MRLVAMSSVERVRICASVETISPWLLDKILQRLIAREVDLAEIKVPITGKNVEDFERLVRKYAPKVIVKPLLNERQGFSTLKKIIEFRPFYVEMEYKNIAKYPEIVDQILTNNVFLLASIDYNDSPTSNKIIHDVMQALNQSDVVKVSFPAESYEDNLKVFEVYGALHDDKQRLIIVAKGEKGYISQLLLPTFGAPFTISSIDENSSKDYVHYKLVQIFYKMMHSIGLQERSSRIL
ncbi:MAG: type I 3-dehydroquinate dehydratase [Thermoproteales archaeon]|nr:type I 3-dehydroquinate dehydratase [Thermoproteales archaeon]